MATNTAALVEVETLAGELLKLVKARQVAKGRIEVLEDDVKVLDEKIMTLMVSDGIDAAANRDYKVAICERAGRQTLDKEKLVELGVGLKTIAAATVVGKAAAFIRVNELHD